MMFWWGSSSKRPLARTMLTLIGNEGVEVEHVMKDLERKAEVEG